MLFQTTIFSIRMEIYIKLNLSIKSHYKLNNTSFNISTLSTSDRITMSLSMLDQYLINILLSCILCTNLVN